MAKMTPLERAIAIVGTKAQLAKRLGIKPQAITQWDEVPAKQVGKVAAITGITPQELRPDLFPQSAA